MRQTFLFILLISGLYTRAQPVVPNPAFFKSIVSIPCTPVKDQSLSSTCWSFAGMSFIESETARKGIQPPDLSEMFIARYSWLNKISRHLATKGKNYLTPGGQFHDILKVMKQYGLAPEEAYDGQPNGGAHNHSLLDTLLTRYISKMVARGKQTPSAADWKYINQVLDIQLGIPPEQFRYDGVSYTPQSFLKERLEFDVNDYIEITSYNSHPWYKPFVLEDKYNWSSDLYWNVPLEDFMAITDSALMNGYTVCWDGDVTEPGFRHENGIAMHYSAVHNYTESRQTSYNSGESRIDHMMHITGIARDSAGNKWYQVKNSWGDHSNPQGGWLFMNEPFFAIKTIAIIVNKNAIPSAIRKKMGI